jgi:hypothetical protein
MATKRPQHIPIKWMHRKWEPQTQKLAHQQLVAEARRVPTCGARSARKLADTSQQKEKKGKAKS